MPIQACVSFDTTGTETAAPTAALPPPLMLPAITFSVITSSAITPTLPPALMTAPSAGLEPSPTQAFVVMLITGTAAWTFTEAVPPKPPPTEISVYVSVEFAATVTLPETVIEPPVPIEASVSLVKTSTTTPTPTPAVPPMPIVPARLRSFVVSVAETATPVVEPPTITPESMWASVLLFSMLTITEPATPALSPPAAPTEIRSMSSLCVADTVRPVPPLACKLAPDPTPASTWPWRSMTITETATPAEEVLTAPPPASRKSVIASEAVMLNDPPACTVPLTSAEVFDGLRTTTMTEPSTAALSVDAPTSSASSWKFSVDAALTSIPPSVVIIVWS